MAVLVALAVAIGVLGFLAFRPSADDSPSRQVRQEPIVTGESSVTVAVVDNDYEPRHLTVRPGTEITWEFEGELPHTVTEPGDAFDSGVLENGDEYILTFRDPGTYYYYCTLHHAMQATVVVAE